MTRNFNETCAVRGKQLLTARRPLSKCHRVSCVISPVWISAPCANGNSDRQSNVQKILEDSGVSIPRNPQREFPPSAAIIGWHNGPAPDKGAPKKEGCTKRQHIRNPLHTKQLPLCTRVQVIRENERFLCGPRFRRLPFDFLSAPPFHGTLPAAVISCRCRRRFWDPRFRVRRGLPESSPGLISRFRAINKKYGRV